MNQVFLVQRVDAGWAKGTSDYLHDSIGKVAPEVTLQAMECRETMCRAEMICDGALGTAAFVDRALRSTDSIWRGAARVLKTGEAPDGKWIVTAFFTKEGSGNL